MKKQKQIFRCFIYDTFFYTPRGYYITDTQSSIVERQSFNNLGTKRETFDETKLFSKILTNEEFDVQSN